MTGIQDIESVMVGYAQDGQMYWFDNEKVVWYPVTFGTVKNGTNRDLTGANIAAMRDGIVFSKIWVMPIDIFQRIISNSTNLSDMLYIVGHEIKL